MEALEGAKNFDEEPGSRVEEKPMEEDWDMLDDETDGNAD